MNQKTFSFKQNTAGITHWKSTGIDNYSFKTDLRGIANTFNDYPKVSCGTTMSVIFSGNYVKESCKVSNEHLYCPQSRFNK